MSFFFIKFAFYGVYYWLPTYLSGPLSYSDTQTTTIISLSFSGGILGSILMGLMSDLLVIKSLTHLVGCFVGALSLFLVMLVHTNTHTAMLTVSMTSFFLFENGATTVIAAVIADLGKDELLRNKRRAVSTLSGINDGIAGLGSIFGQLMVGPILNGYGAHSVVVMFTVAATIACLPTIPYIKKEIENFRKGKAVE